MMITCKSLQVLDQISLIGRWLHTFHFFWAIKKSVHRHLVVHVHLKLFLYVWDFTHIVVIIETYTFIHTSTSVCCVCLWLLLTQWNSIFGVPLINSTDIGQDIPTSFFSLSTLTTPLHTILYLHPATGGSLTSSGGFRVSSNVKAHDRAHKHR